MYWYFYEYKIRNAASRYSSINNNDITNNI